MAASAAEERSDSGSNGSGAPAGGGGKLTLLLSAVNLIVTVGMVAILFVSFQRDRKRPSIDDLAAGSGRGAADGAAKAGDRAAAEGKTADGKPRPKGGDFGKMVTLEQFTVNLSTPGSISPKFVRVNISLEVPTE